jgi:hypothetical protein
MATLETSAVDAAIAAELALLRVQLEEKDQTVRELRHLAEKHGAQGIAAARASLNEVRQAVADELRRASGGSPAGIPAAVELTKRFGFLNAALSMLETTLATGVCLCPEVERVELVVEAPGRRPMKHIAHVDKRPLHQRTPDFFSSLRPGRHLSLVAAPAADVSAAADGEVLPDHLMTTFDSGSKP